MINELHQLADALEGANITTSPWHNRYAPIAHIKRDAPCIQIVLGDGDVSKLISVPPEKESNIRRYGDNQGSFPALNLAPLYRIPMGPAAQEIAALLASDGDGLDMKRVRSWCTSDNWQKLKKKYQLSVVERTQEMLSLLGQAHAFSPLSALVSAMAPFQDPAVLHRELERVAFSMLENREGVVVALRVLFYLDTKEDAKEEVGKLSVVFDSENLLNEGFSTVGPKFAAGLNQALLCADASSQPTNADTADTMVDAFGADYTPIDEPMPMVKLDAGFTVSLRTMFHGQPCQSRYGCFEGGSYPLSKKKRLDLSAALEWVSRMERKDVTWVSTKKGEALFVYPSRLSADYPSLTAPFQRPAGEEGSEGTFEAKAKDFSDYLTRTKAFDPDCYPEWICFFILHQLDKARSKVVYTYNASPDEIIYRSDCWQKASDNLPQFYFGRPAVVFPLRAAQVISRAWKQDGTIADEKNKGLPAYHGMELFFGVSESVLREDLRLLVRNTASLAVYAGRRVNSAWRRDFRALSELRSVLMLMGMFLFWTGHRKDDYMNEYPYLLGQMLKAADYLHELYCVQVRGDKHDQLPQLIGGSLYTAAAEFPNQTFVQLMQRMKPYLNWARSNRNASAGIGKKDGEPTYDPSAGYYLSVFTRIADKLMPALTPNVRFTETEKAQLFIGYLASFPKGKSTQQTEESHLEKGE